MAAFKVLLSFMLVCTTSCQEQSVPPVDLSAVYIADGTIIVTWDSPDVLPGLRISQYFVMVTEAGKSTDFDYLSPDIYVYRFSDIKPDTAYTIKVSTLINGIVSGSVMVNITTDPATYISEGDITRLMLPKPPNTAISVVALNTRTLYQFLYGEIDGDNTTEDGVSVRLTSEYAELEIDSTHVTHAGYYYTKIISGDIVLGGTLIVVTDTPTVPTITSSETLPLVNETVDLECASSVSRSKPDNHGLRMTSTWKLNGSSITDTRFNVKDTSLVITPVLMRDRYNMFTCQTREATEGYSGPPSEDSAEFVLKPRFPARITKLRYQNETEELRPVIPNDVIRLHEADSLVLNVEVDSNPNPNVTLIRHNHVITWTDINGVTGGYDLVLDNLQCDDTGTYDVIASNAVTQNPSEIRFGLQVTCTPRRRYSCDSIIRLTGKRGQTIPLDVIVIANPSPTIRWSTGVMDTSIVQNNSYTYTVQGSVLITSAEGYIHSHVNISNGVGKMLTITFKIRTEAADKTLFKLPFLILAGVVGILTLTIIGLFLVIRRQRTGEDPYHLYASAEVRRGSVLITTVAKQGPHTETDKHPYHVYASADGEVRRENVPTTVSKHAPQTGSDERGTENADKDDREYLELYQSAGAAVNATGDDQEYMDMNQSTVGDENTTEDGRKYQDLYQTTDTDADLKMITGNEAYNDIT